jgi:hypothetical protein
MILFIPAMRLAQPANKCTRASMRSVRSHVERVATLPLVTLVAGDTNGTSDVFVHDLLLGTTERVSVKSNEAQGNGSSYGSSISDDGRYVAFVSTGTTLVEGDTSGGASPDICVRDVVLGTTSRVNVALDGAKRITPATTQQSQAMGVTCRSTPMRLTWSLMIRTASATSSS